MIIPAVRQVGTQQQGGYQLHLQPGHTYRAVVVGQEANAVRLRIGAFVIHGQSQLSLPVGQAIHLKAETSQQHPMMLRVVPNAANASPAPDLGQVLTQLGLNANPATTMVASALLNWLLPVDPAQVRDLVRLLSSVPTEQQEAFLSVRGWAQSAGLEEGESLSTMTRFLLGEAEAEAIPPAMRSINQSEQSAAYPEVRVLWWEQPPHYGEIYVLRDQRRHAPTDSIQLAVRINTLHHGEAWIGFTYSERRLHLSFLGEDEQFLARIKDCEPLLSQAVAQSGVTLAGLSCRKERALLFLDVFSVAPFPAYQGVDILV